LFAIALFLQNEDSPVKSVGVVASSEPSGLVGVKANPNSWCQEIRKLLGHQEIRENSRKSPGNYLNSAGNFVYLRLRCSGEP
jgi:hypothetical protein